MLNRIATEDITKCLEKLDHLKEIHVKIRKILHIMKNSLLSNAEKMFQSLDYLLTKAGVTKWNFTFDALRKILSIKEKLSEYYRKLKLHTKFTERNFTYLEQYILSMSIKMAKYKK